MSTVPSPVSPATPGLLQNPFTYVVLLACYIGYDKFHESSSTARDPVAVKLAQSYVGDLHSVLENIGDQIAQKKMTTPEDVLSAMKKHAGPMGESLTKAVVDASTKDAKGAYTITNVAAASEAFYDAAAGAKKPLGFRGYFK